MACGWRCFGRILRMATLGLGGIFLAQGSEPFDPFQGPNPVLVVIQTEPWAMVIGSETPVYALYEGGQFVFRDQGANKVLRYRTVQLSEIEQKSMIQLLEHCSPAEGFKPSYDLAPWRITDQPELRIYFRVKERTTATRLYAWTLEGPSITKSRREEMNRLDPESGSSDKPEPVLPGQLAQVLERLRNLSTLPSSAWDPCFFEAILWPFPHAKGKGLAWPKNLPQPGSKCVQTLPHRVSVFVGRKDTEALLDFCKRLPQNGAVRFGDKKFAIEVRRVFSGEPLWRRAFQAGE